MLPEMTPAVARALEVARLWAGRLNAAEVGPEHLLCGLLEEEEGWVATRLQAAGLDLPVLRRDLLSGASAQSAPTPDLLLSALAREAFLLAREQTPLLDTDRSVTSEALLLGLLEADQDLRRSLAGRGLDLSSLEMELTGHGTPALEMDEPLDLGEMTERMDTARALDASANRAREALRVLEDYSRFCLDDAFLSGELKRLRHGLVAALDDLPPELLLPSRETLRDVGTTISTASERERHSLGEVVGANVKRLQEALRSLEEFGKLISPDLGARLEGLRYRAYTLERALLLGSTARQRLAECRLQVLLTGSTCAAALDWTIAEAADGGATMFQLREKNLSDRALLERARNVRQWTRQAGALFIVNDRPDVARLVEADGVHLGQDDMSVKDARRIVGPELLIGVSTHTIDQVRQAILDGASYLGVGPTFPSGTKDFADFPGLDFVRQATAETSLPLFVIGGINPQTLPDAVAAGARRVAVSQAVCQADDPRAVVAGMLAVLSQG
jgi:thiamine-phosphate pyrophosphorylase